MHIKEAIEKLTKKTDSLEVLYGKDAEKQRQRYLHISGMFAKSFPNLADVIYFSTPGRTEIGGNHTDHNAGHVLAGAINLDIIAVVASNENNNIHIISEGYDDIKVNLSSIEKSIDERRKSVSLVRGICARFIQLGYRIRGFKAYVTSEVKDGSGLSSSAAFEVLIATILNYMFNEGKIDPVQIAQIAQYSENNYFDKPCGLMDQTACAVGGLVQIDFKNFDNPVVKNVIYDFSKSNYALVIVFAGEGHEELNDEYEMLENEMKAVAKALGGKVLRDFSKEVVIENIKKLRKQLSDRAILRALHFYSDDERVIRQTDYLENGNFIEFLKDIIDSGYSSWMLCQNVYVNSYVIKQGLSIALAVSKEILLGKGAWRVHGGGFGGTIQAFVPDNLVDYYIEQMDTIFGKGSSIKLDIRNKGTTIVEI